MLVFKICHEDEWRAALSDGRYEGSAKDREDGFLHFSAADQLLGTLQKWYVREADLQLVAVDTAALGDALKWEPSRAGALFPHLYGPLPLSAVAWVEPIGRTAQGEFALPSQLVK